MCLPNYLQTIAWWYSTITLSFNSSMIILQTFWVLTIALLYSTIILTFNNSVGILQSFWVLTIAWSYRVLYYNEWGFDMTSA